MALCDHRRLSRNCTTIINPGKRTYASKSAIVLCSCTFSCNFGGFMCNSCVYSSRRAASLSHVTACRFFFESFKVVRWPSLRGRLSFEVVISILLMCWSEISWHFEGKNVTFKLNERTYASPTDPKGVNGKSTANSSATLFLYPTTRTSGCRMPK